MTVIELCSAIVQIQDTYYTQQVHIYISIFIWIVGVSGNLVNIVVFGRKHMVSPVNSILWWLAVSDLVELVAFALYGWCAYIELFYPDRDAQSHYLMVLLLSSIFLLQVFHTITVGLNVILAFWRYLAVAHPLQNKIRCDNDSVKLTVVGIYVLSFALCLPVLYELTIFSSEEQLDNVGNVVQNLSIGASNETLYYIDFRKEDDLFAKLSFFIYSVVLRIGPSIILTVISIKLILTVISTRRVRQHLLVSWTAEKQRQMNRITNMIMVILFIFLITEMPMGVMGVLAMINDYEFFFKCQTKLRRFPQLTALINSSYNTFCYLIMSTQYRKELKLLATSRRCEQGRPNSSDRVRVAPSRVDIQ